MIISLIDQKGSTALQEQKLHEFHVESLSIYEFNLNIVLLLDAHNNPAIRAFYGIY